MGKEAFKIWCRNILKKIINPNYFIMVSANFSELEMTHQVKHNFGKFLDGLFEIMAENDTEAKLGFRIDELLRKFLPQLLRNGLRR